MAINTLVLRLIINSSKLSIELIVFLERGPQLYL